MSDADPDPQATLGIEAQLRELRAALPRRPLRLDEGLRIAERQADLLRWQMGADRQAALSLEAVARMGIVTVTYRAGLAKSGLITKTAQGWVMVLRADEPIVRQRFSACHELKHLLDDELVTAFPAGLYRGRFASSAQLAERVCDRFAAALLMPKLMLRRDWTSGLQDVGRLARRYQVSVMAMEVRLREIGLVEAVPRCGVGTR